MYLASCRKLFSDQTGNLNNEFETIRLVWLRRCVALKTTLVFWLFLEGGWEMVGKRRGVFV